jgi:cell division protein FtsW (lipid II flippase)
MGIAAAFFLYFAVNMAMVMGLAPVVGVPLPLVSYGGSAMLVLMVAFGLVQSRMSTARAEALDAPRCPASAGPEPTGSRP